MRDRSTLQRHAGIIGEGEEFIEEQPDEMLMDAGLITAAQKVEHYEFASYGCLTTYARLLGFEDDARLLYRTLAEEKATDAICRCWQKMPA